LFVVLVVIAVYVHDTIIRPFVGDTLAVIWLYYTAKSLLNISVLRLSTGVLILSYCVELAQYFNIVTLLGLQDVKIAKIVLGSTFDVMDIAAYTVGWLIVVFVSKLNLSMQNLSYKNRA
jgi:hypothetical protein